MKKLLNVLIIVLFFGIMVASPVTAPVKRTEDFGDFVGNVQPAEDSEETSIPPGTQTTPSQVEVLVAPAAEYDAAGNLVVTTDSKGIEEDDLGIAQEETGVEGEEIGVIQDSNDETKAKTVHLDLEGQTQGNEMQDDPDDEKSGGTVIIKGSSIPENYPDKDHADWIDVLSNSVKSEKDLELYAAATAATDSNVEHIKLTYTEVEMSYKQPAKLFGLIPVTYTATVLVGEEIYPDEYGRVKVSFPWWLIFTTNNANELESEIKKWEEQLSSIGDDAQLANIDPQNQLQKQQQILQTMSNIMKTKHDAAKAAINNVR